MRKRAKQFVAAAMAGVMAPVSYTHLDVYKRQNRNRTERFFQQEYQDKGIPAEPDDCQSGGTGSGTIF